jgi:Matrixin
VRALLFVASTALAGAAWLVAGDALAYCRATTCEPSADYQPAPGTCEPSGWAATCKSNGLNDFVVWWRGACVGWDVQKDGSKNVSYSDAVNAATGAFAQWSQAACSGQPVSISTSDLGPVDCTQAGYNENGPNQNLIVFHDDAWPYWTQQEIQQHIPSPTIALTTVTFDRDTGELYDADIEINSADHTVILTDQTGGDVYDLRSVLTHEGGHFLGMGHSADVNAVMYSADEGSDIKKRTLQPDDVAGICSIYPANGTRVTDPSVLGGSVQNDGCDPTPRHGFTSECSASSPTSQSGCAVAGDGDFGAGEIAAGGLFSLVAARAVRRRAGRRAA